MLKVHVPPHAALGHPSYVPAIKCCHCMMCINFNFIFSFHYCIPNREKEKKVHPKTFANVVFGLAGRWSFAGTWRLDYGNGLIKSWFVPNTAMVENYGDLAIMI